LRQILQQLKDFGVLKLANLLAARPHCSRKRTQSGHHLLAIRSLGANCRQRLLNQIHRHANID
jgi:hypothetical protein